MSRFDVQKFLADPSSELNNVKYAKKQDLTEVAEALELVIGAGKTKLDLKKVIFEYYIGQNILGQEARQYFLPEGTTLTVEQQLEFERLAVERERANSESEKVRLKL